MNKKYFFFIICGLFIYTNKTPEVSNYQHKGKKKKKKEEEFGYSVTWAQSSTVLNSKRCPDHERGGEPSRAEGVKVLLLCIVVK